MEHHRNTSLENIVEEIDGVVYYEEWKPIIDYAGLYEISGFGRVKRLKRFIKTNKSWNDDKIILPTFEIKNRKKRYLRICLRKDKKQKQYTIHRLVVIHFHEKIDGKNDTNHITGIKTKNHYSQLEWCTPQENNEHAARTGLSKRGITIKPYIKKGYGSKFKKVINIQTREIYPSMHEVAKKLNYSVSYLGKQLRGDRLNTTPFRYIGKEDMVRKTPYKEKPKNPVGVFDINWKFIRTFDYRKDAALFCECCSSDILEFLKGERSIVKGYKFKKTSDGVNFVEPIPFVPYVRPPKKVKIKKPNTPSKMVVKCDVNGNTIETYGSIGLAAKALVCDKRQFRNSVRKNKRGYYKGFIYKIMDKPQT